MIHRSPRLYTSRVLYVVLLTGVGLFVRLYALGARGFWFDEIAFAYTARLQSFDALLSYVNAWGDHTPFSFFLVWLARGLGGDEAALRLPFAIAGALGVPALYLLGKALARTRVGLLAALLYALSPFAVFYSQDTHPYTPLMLFTTLQLLFAYRAATTSRPLDWVGLAVFTLLNLYNDYLALAPTAVATTFLGVDLLGRLASSIRKRPQPPDNNVGSRAQEFPILGAQFVGFIATSAAVALLYLPWLSPTLAFLKQPVRAFYASHTGPATFDDLRNMAHGLGFDKFLLIFLFTGALYTLLSLLRERRLSNLLLAIWIAAPLAGLWWLTGDRMFLLQTRYYSFLVPAALILIALGVNWLASFATQLQTRLLGHRSNTAAPSGIPSNNNVPSRYVSGATFAVLLAIILALAVPAVVSSYSWPKVVPQDYRGAVAYIVDESSPGSVVFSVGLWGLKPAPPPSVWAVQGVEYYLWLYRSSIPYLDASLLDEYTASHMGSKDATIWGAVVLPWPIEPLHLKSAADMGLEVIQFEGITLVRQRAPRASPSQQLDTLLAWGTSLQPGLAATRALLNPAYRASDLGENVLPPISDVQVPARAYDVLNGEQQPDKWVLWANTSLAPDGKSLVLTSPEPNGETNLTLSTRKLVPGATYVLTFRYRNTQFAGLQRVYLSTNKDPDLLIETFPYGAGFECVPNSASASAFAFKVPSAATNAILWLRINGTGTAEFTSIELRPLR